MSLPFLSFTSNPATEVTTTASYAAVPLYYDAGRFTSTPIPSANWWRSYYHSGALGIGVRNTHVSSTMFAKIVAYDTVATDGTGNPANIDPTTWPVVVAEQSIAAASAALAELDIQHHLFYAVLVKQNSAAGTCTVQGISKPKA